MNIPLVMNPDGECDGEMNAGAEEAGQEREEELLPPSDGSRQALPARRCWDPPFHDDGHSGPNPPADHSLHSRDLDSILRRHHRQQRHLMVGADDDADLDASLW